MAMMTLLHALYKKQKDGVGGLGVGGEWGGGGGDRESYTTLAQKLTA